MHTVPAVAWALKNLARFRPGDAGHGSDCRLLPEETGCGDGSEVTAADFAFWIGREGASESLPPSINGGGDVNEMRAAGSTL